MTSAIGGTVTRSVQTSASAPFGGVGVGMCRGGSVGDADGTGVGGSEAVWLPGAVSHALPRKAMLARTTASGRPARFRPISEGLFVLERYGAPPRSPRSLRILTPARYRTRTRWLLGCRD